MLKRAIDVVGSLLGLILLAPLLLLLGVLVRLDSPGPVLFRQERVGRYGRIFRIHKFRTMVVGAPGMGPAVTAASDPRVTATGRWLRHYKLDELPQLIDVLCGDMSLVGPRPEVPRYVAAYSAEQRLKVLSVRPGITDLASLEFVDESELLGGTPDAEGAYLMRILPQKLALAERYVDSQCLRLDLSILARTISKLVRR